MSQHPTQSQHSTQNQQSGFFKSFTEHPASVGETYWQHLIFAGRFSIMLFAAAFAALIHAIIPAFFETTASKTIRKMFAEMESRHN